EYPDPLTCTVLYLAPGTGALRAYDEITLGGLGETEVTIQRTVVPPGKPGSGDRASPTDAPTDGTPASPTG
ncbi:MAG TPA: metallophosphoesterase, partial [Blastococcus sp.]